MDQKRYETLAQQNSIARQQAEDQVFIVQQYAGSVKQDQGLVDAQALNISYCRIVSPITGRVGLRLVDPGNYVQTTSSTGIAVITQLQPISVVFSVPEDELPEFAPQFAAGSPLIVTAYDRANLRQLAGGKVSAIDNQIDTTTGTVKVRAQFDNEDNTLFPNQFVNVRLLVKTLQNAVTVPTSAIQRGAPGTYVYVINADNTVSVRQVSTGPVDGNITAVNSGLSAGERVVTDGTDRLRDGVKVLVAGEGQGGQGGQAGTPGGAPGGASGQGRTSGQPSGRSQNQPPAAGK
jgi:multidrug efflux system membrane fusion protein